MQDKTSKTVTGWSKMPFPIKIIDRNVPASLAVHLKILLFILVVEGLMMLFEKRAVLSERTLSDLVLLACMMESFIWLAYIIFIKGIHLGETAKEITKNIIIRYIIYYIACLGSAIIIFILFLYGLYFIHGWNTADVLHNFFNNDFKVWFKNINLGLFLGAFFFVIGIWQEALKQAQALKEEKLVFRYETLRNQVNPHFLFNSLNTLSSLVSSNPELAEKFIQKLSSIYRYVLENREVELVDLKSEIDFVTDYFYLQQIRDEDKISLKIEIPETSLYKIQPMSLQLLVENALKHNLATREKPLNIHITQRNDKIEVKNNLQKKISAEPSSGTGLKNLAERVKYITKREVQVSETSSEFKVTVPIIPK